MATITENYVSFEIAKLLKKKRFDWKCFGYYVEDEPDDVKYSALFETNSDWEERCCSAPTQQTAMKWLRETHSIAIEPMLLSHGWFCQIEKILEDFCKEYIDETDSYKTYEEAVEAAIKYCLENLI